MSKNSKIKSMSLTKNTDKVYKFSKNSRQKMSLSQQLRREREAKKLTGFNNLNTRVPIYEGAILKGYLDQEPSVAKFVKAYEKAIKKPKGQKIKRSKVMGNGCFAIFLLIYTLGMFTYFWVTKSSEVITGEVKQVYAKKVDVVEIEEVKVESTIEEYICSKDWDCNIALAVLTAENRNWDCQAVNTGNFDGSVDRGLMQINSVHNYPIDELFDCNKNIDYAYKIYESQGWNAWTAYWRGNYKDYL